MTSIGRLAQKRPMKTKNSWISFWFWIILDLEKREICAVMVFALEVVSYRPAHYDNLGDSNSAKDSEGQNSHCVESKTHGFHSPDKFMSV